MGKLLFNQDQQRVEEITETRPIDTTDLKDEIAALENELVEKRAFLTRVENLAAKNQTAAAAPAPAPTPQPSPEPSPEPTPAPAEAAPAPAPAAAPQPEIPATPGY